MFFPFDVYAYESEFLFLLLFALISIMNSLSLCQDITFVYRVLILGTRSLGTTGLKVLCDPC